MEYLVRFPPTSPGQNRIRDTGPIGRGVVRAGKKGIMTLTSEKVRGTVVVGVEGKLIGGLENVDRFHELFRSHLDTGEKYFVVDLGQTSWANSQGIGMLIGAYTSARKAGGNLVLANGCDRITNILRVTRLDYIFRCFESVEEATDDLMAKAGDGRKDPLTRGDDPLNGGINLPYI